MLAMQIRLKILILMLLVLVSSATASPVTRDPTKPWSENSGQGEGIERYVLHSTLIAPGRNIAIINNTIVEVGDEIAGAKVRVIKPDTVLLSVDGRPVLLKLIGKAIRKRIQFRARPPWKEIKF